MISVTILTKNSAQTLPATLHSLKAFSEVIIFDTGSQDTTLEIAHQYPNVKCLQGTLTGFGPTHNEAASHASHDWILSIDSDEVLSEELSQEILSLSLHRNTVYSLNRENSLFGEKIRHSSGWYPDPVLRLYHRKTTQFSEDPVHERLLTEHMKVSSLKSPLFHTPYRTIEDFLQKMQLYSSLFAHQMHGKKQSSLSRALLHSWSAFWKSYLLKWGFLGGRKGLILALYHAHTTYYKYLKLAFLDQRL